MRAPVKARRLKRSSQSGVALLIAIFALMLISVVAIALVVSIGTDSALANNFRSDGAAYYASLAGLEEARGRLLWSNPYFINKSGNYSGVLFDTSMGVMSAAGATTVVYITNPASGEVVDPTNPANPYYDNEYDTEFQPAWQLSGANVITPFIQSVSPIPSASLPGPAYKWVRINPVTGKSTTWNVDGYGPQPFSLYYDPAANPNPGLVSPITPSQTAMQVLSITSLAVLPSGSKRLLQYLVAPLTLYPDLPVTGGFPAALTLAGTNAQFQGGSAFTIHGDESVTSSPPGCTDSTLHPAIGYTTAPPDLSLNNINTGANPPANYTGGSPLTFANINDSTQTNYLLGANWQNPVALDSIIQTVTQSADVVVNGPASQSIMPAAMSASNPMTIVVNGDLTFTSWHGTGYGILVVTGTFDYDPDATWNGIILVVGQGTFVSTRGGTGTINGAVLVAKTRDASGNLLANLGAPSFSQQSGAINYSSCWITKSLGPNQGTYAGPIKYRVLSFREIPTS